MPDTDARLAELIRQRTLLDGEIPVRLLAATLAYGLCIFFLPVWVVAACAGFNFAAEVCVHRLFRNPERLARPGGDRVLLALTMVLEICFTLPPALLWQMPDAYAKAYAVGMVSGTMMHVATVRAIYLPMGLAGAVAIAAATLAGNAVYWIGMNNPAGLAITTLCALLSLGYFLAALLSNNRLHREAAVDRADAEAADAAKGRFLAQMSHELRTPLNAILGMGQTVLRRHGDAETQDQLAVLIAAAESLKLILDDILDISAVQDGRVPIRRRTADPGAEIAATVALFGPSAAAAGLSLHLTLQDGLPPLAVFDPQRLRQCLSNLLSNAIKFTPAGHIVLNATARRAEGPDLLLVITVADTGPGISAADQARLFLPFAKGDLQQHHAGNGLGLSISRGLARAMGGDLRLLPDGGPGARFVLSLRLGPAVPPPASEGTLPRLAGLRALIVDDVATNRMVAAAHLKALGIASCEASSGAQAVALLEQESVDLVLLDMHMPGMDGLQTLHRLRALPGRARLPVIAMTADALDAQRRAGLAAGLDGYLVKPLDTAELATAIAAAVAVS